MHPFMYVAPIRLGLLSRTNQIVTSKGTSDVKLFKICFRFENSHCLFLCTAKKDRKFHSSIGLIFAISEGYAGDLSM